MEPTEPEVGPDTPGERTEPADPTPPTPLRSGSARINSGSQTTPPSAGATGATGAASAGPSNVSTRPTLDLPPSGFTPIYRGRSNLQLLKDLFTPLPGTYIPVPLGPKIRIPAEYLTIKPLKISASIRKDLEELDPDTMGPTNHTVRNGNVEMRIPHVGPHLGIVKVGTQYVFESHIRQMMANRRLNLAQEANYRLQGVQVIDSVRSALLL